MRIMITEKDKKGKKIEGLIDMRGVGRLESLVFIPFDYQCLLSMYCSAEHYAGKTG